jgi:hypothetical protein
VGQNGKQLRGLFCGEMRNDLFELHVLIRSDRGKFEPECLSPDPTDLRFINAERPVQSWSIDTALEHCAHHHGLFSFDTTAAIGQIQRLALSFALAAGKRASKLSGESRLLPFLDTPVISHSLCGFAHALPSM